MGSRNLGAMRAALLAGAILIVGAPLAEASADTRRGDSRFPVADGPLPAKLAAKAPEDSSHHGPSVGHLPPRQQELELVGRLEPKGAFGDIVPGQIADLAVHKGFAYLNSWDSADCARGGTYVVDIRDPSQPKEVGFIAAPPDFYHGEGAHVVSIDTPSFRGDLLAVNDETYGSNILGTCSDPLDKSFGGFDLYDVSNPASPVPLVQGAGDRDADNDPATPERIKANSYHSVFVWQDGPRAYLVASDNIEFTDVDIFDITDPRNPVQVGDFDLVERAPQILAGEEANGGAVFHHDVVVKQIEGRPVMLADYWDAGYVQLDVSNPANPIFITDTRFAGEDPLLPGSGLTPEGNAHQGEFSFDNQFLLTADEDFGPFRQTVRATSGPTTGISAPVIEGDSTARVADLPDGILNGPSVFVGDGCDPATFPAAPADDGDPNTDDIALIERGGTLPSPPDPPGTSCGFAAKFANATAKGWDGVIIFNQVRPDDGFVGMLTGPGSIPGVQMRRVDALGASGVLSTSTTTPALGTPGPAIEIGDQFDGWGYAHLYDAKTSQHLDAFAIPEALDERFVDGFGDLSIHEFATDPTTNLAYASWYAGGIRVFRFSRANGLEQTGAWISEGVDGQGPGSNFWGVEQFTTPQGERLIAGSDRDYGLVILRYTGPGAPTPAGPGPPSGAPSNRLQLRVGRYRNGKVRLFVSVRGPGRLRAGLRANLPRLGAARVVKLASASRRVARASTVVLTLRLSPAKRRRVARALEAKGRVNARVNLAWKPTGGTTRRASRKLVIRR